MIKKIFIPILFMFLWTAAGISPAAGQHYLGIRGGYGMGMDAGFDNGTSIAMKTESVWGLWSGGLVWKYYTPENHYGRFEKHLAGISMEVELLQKAYEFYIRGIGDYTDRSYRRYFSSIHLPIIWQPHINMWGNRFRLFLNLGVWASYNLPTGSRVEYYEAGEFTGERYDYEFKLIRDNPFGYGLCGGLGFDIAIGDRFSVSLEGRYYHSFGDILRPNNKYPNEPVGIEEPGYDPTFIIENPRRSPVGNINISVSVLYRLSDGVYNPRPTKRALRREEERRTARLMEQLRQELEQREEQAEPLQRGTVPQQAERLQEEVLREAVQDGTGGLTGEEAGMPREVAPSEGQLPDREAQLLEVIELKAEENGDDQATEGGEADTERH